MLIKLLKFVPAILILCIIIGSWGTPSATATYMIVLILLDVVAFTWAIRSAVTKKKSEVNAETVGTVTAAHLMAQQQADDTASGDLDTDFETDIDTDIDSDIDFDA